MILSQLPILLFFLAISIFVFYIPGSLFLKKAKNKFRDDERIVLSIGLGFIVFLLLGVLAALLEIRWIVLPLLALVNIFAIVKYKLTNFSPFLGLIKQKILLAFLLLGTLVEGFINFPSGLLYNAGNLYWSSQGHDGLWHIAIIEAMKQKFPPTNPLYAGESLYNYHYLADFIIAEFNRIFSFFSSSDLFFRDFSFLISFLMGLAAYSFLTTWKQNKTIGYLGIFFTYFVGSFGYIVLLIQHRGFFGGETIFWAAQGNTIIGNMPHAFNYFLLPAFFLAFYYFLKDKSNLFLVLCFLLGGFLVGFKVSAGAVLLAGLGVACLGTLIFKQNKKIFILTAALGISNLITFKLITKEGESLLMF
ncbi:MAG: hypothetical protein Q8Q24_02235, partial [bacterium]|nr:hypothetical protein [bacterium]